MASTAAFVQQLLQSAPQSGALSLAGQRLGSDALAALAPMLHAFPRLAELDLADNQLDDIADVAQLAHLHRLVRFDAGTDAAQRSAAQQQPCALAALWTRTRADRR